MNKQSSSSSSYNQATGNSSSSLLGRSISSAMGKRSPNNVGSNTSISKATATSTNQLQQQQQQQQSSNQQQQQQQQLPYRGARRVSFQTDVPPLSGLGINATNNTPNGGTPNSRATSDRMGATIITNNNNSNNNNWYFRAKRHRTVLYQCILNHKAWNIGMIIGTILLLFGAQIRDLILFPPVFDIIFNVLFILCLIFMTADIIMRVDSSEPNYFDCFGIRWNMGNSTYNNPYSKRKQNTFLSKLSCCCTFNISTFNKNTANFGSFLFWCDVISTLTLLYEISWINPRYFNQEVQVIHVNDFGIPIHYMGQTDLGNGGQAVQINNMDLYVSIGKTARMARFIRSATLVKLSSKINWYYLLNFFNPIFYCRLLYKGYHEGFIITFHDAIVSIFGGENDHNLTDEGSTDQLSNPNNKKKKALHRNSKKRARSVTAADENRSNAHDGFDIGDDDDTTTNHSVNETTTNAATTPTTPTPTSKLKSFHPWKRSKNSLSNVASSVASRNPVAMLSSAVSTISISEYTKSESQVGSAMREITSQRVALGILIGLVLTVLFTYTEYDITRSSTMVVLHNQTGTVTYAQKALIAARNSSVPTLFSFQLGDNVIEYFDGLSPAQPDPLRLRPREILQINVTDTEPPHRTTVGRFNNRNQRFQEAIVSLLYTLFIVLVWVFGVTAFAGPVMVLVVIPIERMVRLLAMLMIDPLGYQSTPAYKQFVTEGDDITKNTRWSKDVLKGMETSFL